MSIVLKMVTHEHSDGSDDDTVGDDGTRSGGCGPAAAMMRIDPDSGCLGIMDIHTLVLNPGVV